MTVNEQSYPLLSTRYILRRVSRGTEITSRLICIDGKEIALNDASEKVAGECDGGSSVVEIASRLARIFDKTPPETIMSRLQAMLAALHDQGAMHFLDKPLEAGKRRMLARRPLGEHPLIRLFLEVTNACNLKCSHCYLGDIDERRDLPKGDIERLLREYFHLGGESLILSGGEPFLREDLLEIVEFASSLPLFITVLSNGLLIDDAIAKTLSRYTIQEVQISLDGARPETHDTYRRSKGAHRAAIRAIEALLRAGIKVDVGTMVNRSNLGELADLVDLCGEWGIMPGLSHQTNMGRAQTVGRKYQLSLCEYSRTMIDVRRHITERTDERPFTVKVPVEANLEDNRCSAGQTSIAIRANGDAFVCLDLIEPDHVLGNIHERSLEEIWNSENSFLRMMRSITLKDLLFCRDCKHFAYCTGGCPAAAYEVWGDYNMPDPKRCIYYTMAREHLTFEPDDESEGMKETLIRCDK